MLQTIIEVLLIWIAFFVGVYQQHLSDVLQGLWRSPRQWRQIVKGMWASKTFIALATIIAMSVGIYFLNTAQENAEEEYTERIINAIDGTTEKRNQRVDELLDRIDKMLEQNAKILERLEVQNVSGNTTSK
ncbi:hypothetical protein ACFLWI_01430 [Chloroflexota bacterium]